MTFEELKSYFMNDRVAMNLGCEIVEADNTHAVVAVDIDERHYNGNNKRNYFFHRLISSLCFL